MSLLIGISFVLASTYQNNNNNNHNHNHNYSRNHNYNYSQNHNNNNNDNNNWRGLCTLANLSAMLAGSYTPCTATCA